MRRSGFTLVELLVVLTVLAILFAIGFMAYASAIENARVVATRATIVELQLAVDARASLLAKRNVRSLTMRFQEAYRQGGNPAPNDQVPLKIAEIMVRKDQYKQTMPTRLEDLWGFDASPGTPDDSPLWNVWKQTVQASGLPATDADPRPTGHRRDLENSELLFLSLTEGAIFGSGGYVQIDRIIARHKADANRNGITEFIDDWGHPIRFYGWTHRLVRPGGGTTPINQDLFAHTAHVLLTAQSPPATPTPFPIVDTTVTPNRPYYNHPLNQDQDDFTGAFSSAQAATGLLVTPFRMAVGGAIVTCPAFGEEYYHALDTRGISMVISAGPDGVLGLVEPTEETAPERRTAEPIAYTDPSMLDAVFDNITTRH